MPSHEIHWKIAIGFWQRCPICCVPLRVPTEPDEGYYGERLTGLVKCPLHPEAEMILSVETTSKVSTDGSEEP